MFDPHRLFTGPERLGWEMADLGGLEPAPADGEPVWVEPPPPDEQGYAAALQQARASGIPGPVVAVGVVVLFITGLLLLTWSWFGWIPAIGAFAGIWFLLRAAGAPEREARADWERRQQAYQEHRQELWERYQREVAAWRDQVDLAEEAAQRRLAEAPLWYPLATRGAMSRIDVIGGSPGGWNSLLATFGCSRLSAGAGLLVLDLSERDAAGDLTALAAQVGRPATRVRLPEERARVDLLGGLSDDEVVTVLTDAIVPAAAGPAVSEDRATDADLLRTVVRCLDGPATVPRLAAGVRALLGRHEDGAAAVLTPEEAQRLVEEMDLATGTERARERLRMLRVNLDLLDGADPPPQSQGLRVAAGNGLTVLETGEHDRGRKELLDRVTVHTLRQRLRAAPAAGWRQTVVVAGADALGGDAIERIARQCERSQVQLMLLFQHLRDDAERLLGAGGGATVVMRLGNGREAATAAEFIGRGHRFELSQLTMQVGQTTTDTQGTSSGGSEGSSETETSGISRAGGGLVGNRASSRSVSQSTSRSMNWSQSVSQAWSESRQGGQTRARVYEFHVEPTVLQSLPETAFALVGGPDPRRVVFGDCNPAIASYPRVAPDPAHP